MRLLKCYVLAGVLTLNAAWAEDRHDAAGDLLPDGAVRRLGTVRLRHHDQAAGVVFSKTGAEILSSGSDNVVRVWDAKTGRQVRALFCPDPQRDLSGVLITPDGQTVMAIAGFDILSWDFKTGKYISSIKASDGHLVFALAVSPDGSMVASGGRGGTVAVFDRTTKRRRHSLPIPGFISDLAFSPDNRRLVVASKQGAEVWDLESGERKTTLKGKGAKATGAVGVAYSPDGRFLAVALSDAESRGRVAIFDAATHERRHVLSHHEGGTFAWSPDSGRFVLTDWWGGLYLWETKTWKRVRADTSQRVRLDSIAFSPDGSSLAAGSTRAVLLLDAATLHPRLPMPGHQADVQALAISSDGEILASGPDEEPILLWNVRSGKSLGKLPYQSNGVTSLDFAPGTHYLAAGFWHKTLRVWDTATKQLLFQHEGKEDQWQYVRCAPDGKSVAWSSGKMIRIIDIPSGKQTRVLLHRSALTHNRHHGLDYSPDGQVLAYLDDGTALRWKDGKQTIALRRPRYAHDSPAFSPDGRIVALDGHDRAGFYELDGSEQWRALADKSPDRWLGFHPSGAYVLSGSEDGHLQLWETASAKICATFTGKQGRCLAAVFTPDGRYLATAGQDTTILLWDLASLPKAQSAPRSGSEAYKLTRQLEEKDVAGAFLAIGALVRGGNISLRSLKDVALRGKGLGPERALAALDMIGTPAALYLLRTVKERLQDPRLKALVTDAVHRHDGLRPAR